MRRAGLVLLSLLPVTAGLLGCGGLKDSYGKEFVLYDSSRKAATPDAARPPSDQDAADGFARILLLEQVFAELERAILDGRDQDGALARKRRAVDDELRRRIADAGAQLGPWRAARVAELERFATR